MKTMGVCVASGQLRYTILEGTRSEPVLSSKERLVTPDPNQVPELMDWYETRFIHILETHAPDRIGCRLTLNPKKKQIFTSIFPLGILFLLAYRRGLPINEYVAANYTASKFKLPKGTDLYRHCDTVFGDNPPYWDDTQKHSLLAAWLEME
jgi:hypothetical protein